MKKIKIAIAVKRECVLSFSVVRMQIMIEN